MHTSIMVEYLTSLASFTAKLTQLCIAYDKQMLVSRSATGFALVHLSVQRMLFHVVPGCAKIGSELKST